MPCFFGWIGIAFYFLQLLLKVLLVNSDHSILLIPPQGTSDPYVILQLNGQTAKSNIKWA